MKRYEGVRHEDGVTVTVDGKPLDPRYDIWNHSQRGFDWGFGGHGPAQLALALLADHLNDTEKAVRIHQQFKWAVIARLPSRENWTLTSQEIEESLAPLADCGRRTPWRLNTKT